MSDTIELALAPLDRVRVRALHWTMPLSSRLARAREARVAAIGSSVVVIALLATLLAPLWLLALGPILLGVPHLLADVRYCLVRPGWHRERALWLTAGVPLLAVACGSGFEIGLLGVAASALVISGELRRRVAVAVAALVLAFVGWRLESLADLFLAHAHNFIAVALWASWRPRASKLHWIPLAAFVLLAAALLLGLGDPVWSRSDPIWWSRGDAGLPSGLDRNAHLAALAPSVPGVWASRLVLLYCFAQAVHYGVWLRMVPEDDRERPTPRSFRASYRALRDDFHPLILAGFALAAVALAIWACVDLVEARTGYFRFARFHGMLELLAAGLLLAHGRPRRLISGPPPGATTGRRTYLARSERSERLTLERPRGAK